MNSEKIKKIFTTTHVFDIGRDIVSTKLRPNYVALYFRDDDILQGTAESGCAEAAQQGR